MLSSADFNLGDAVALLSSKEVEAAFLVPTATGLKKGILDAHASVRDFLARSRYHEYEGQKQGPQGKVTKTAYFVLPKELVSTSVTLYRPKAKGLGGDPRIWFARLGTYAAPKNLLALFVVEGSLYLVNVSRDDVRISLDDRNSAFQRLLASKKLGRPPAAEILLRKLRVVASGGWLRTVTSGDTGVGATLEHHLGIKKNSSKAPDFHGIEIKAKRHNRPPTRSVLFAKVPNWSLSQLKSSAEILDTYGYARDGTFKLNCSVVAKKPNSQGLFLQIEDDTDLLRERHLGGGKTLSEVCVWVLSDLQAALSAKHSETFWVAAESKFVSGVEYFRYVFVRHTKSPFLAYFPTLCAESIISLDHVIERGYDGKVTEKGPLFKIAPKNLGRLFPSPETHLLF